MRQVLCITSTCQLTDGKTKATVESCECVYVTKKQKNTKLSPLFFFHYTPIHFLPVIP